MDFNLQGYEICKPLSILLNDEFFTTIPLAPCDKLFYVTPMA